MIIFVMHKAQQRTIEYSSTSTVFFFRFSIHRLVMMISSQYFRALLGSNFKEGVEKEVSVGGLDGPTLKAIIDYCYTGNMEINEEYIEKIVSAASWMDLVRIEEKCEKVWREKLSSFNCVETFSLADKYSLTDLREKSLDFICEHFEAVAAGQLQEVGLQYFCEFFKCDRIHALEEHIFQRLIQWVDFDEEARSKYVPELLNLINLKKIATPVRLRRIMLIFFTQKLPTYCIYNSTICSQVLIDVVGTFAKKYNCSGGVTDEQHRRHACTEMECEPYRYTTTPTKSLFVASFNKNMFFIEKYYPISEQWGLFGVINMAPYIKRSYFGQVFAQDKLFIVGGWTSKGQTYLRTVSMQRSKLRLVAFLRDKFLSMNWSLDYLQIFIFGGFHRGALSDCERYIAIFEQNYIAVMKFAYIQSSN